MQSLVVSKIRTKRIPAHLFVAGSAWVSRIATALLQLISVRILTKSLGIEQYAVFALITSLIGWFMISDLGIGYSLQNFISQNRAEKKPYGQFLANAILAALLLLFATLGVLYIISSFLAPILLKQFSFLEDVSKIKIFFTIGSMFLCLSIGGISYKVWYGEQKGYLSNIVPALASLIGFCGIWFVAETNINDKLFWSLVAFVAPTALLALLSLLSQAIFLKKEYWHFQRSVFTMIAKRGLKFWVFALLSSMVLQVDYIIMSQFVTAYDITIYNVSNKIFMLIFFIYNAVLMALWPVFAERIALNDWPSVTNYLKRYLILGISYMVLATVIVTVFIPYVINIISPNAKIEIPISFLIILGVYQVIRIWTDTFAIVLQSMSDLKPLWRWVPIQALLSILIQIVLSPFYGIYGIMLGLIGSYALTVMWALPQAVMKHIKST